MRKTIAMVPANANLAGFASNVTGAAFTLAATAPTDGLAHRVSIKNDSGTDHSGKTVTLVGTDADGKPITEVVTGPGASATVESTSYLLTLTSATPSATIGADTFDIGWVDEVITRTVPLDRHATAGCAMAADIAGTINFTVQETFDDVQASDLASQSVSWHAVTALASKTADTVGVTTPGATAARLVVNSYTDGATLSLSMSQPSVR